MNMNAHETRKFPAPILSLILLLLYGLMITMNVVANALPLNGLNTGEISDRYNNLFTPAGYTFSIWGIIYLLLLTQVLYLVRVIKAKDAKLSVSDLKKVCLYFSLSTLLNGVWIVAWHFLLIPLSLVLTFLLAATLWQASRFLTKAFLGDGLSNRERYFLRLPTEVYFGWSCVALIANVTVWLVDIGWKGWGIAPEIWTILILLIGCVIAVLTVWTRKSPAFGIVFLWAYGGILQRHLSQTNLDQSYPIIIGTVSLALVFILIAIFATIFLSGKKKVNSDS